MMAAVMATHDEAGAIIRVVLVDDHAVVRSGLRLMLASEADIEVVGEAENGERAVFEVLANRPDVVVMDLQMPGISGIDAIPSVLQAVPEARSWFFHAGRPALRASGFRSRGERIRPEGCR